MLEALSRWGGFFVQPRRHAASLSPDEGLHDGVWLTLLYVLGSQVYPLVEGLATAWAVRDLGALVMLGGTFARTLLAPIVVVIFAETVLGAGRSYRSRIALLPLVVLTTLGHMLGQMGIPVPGPSFTAAALGGLLGVALVGWIRNHVAPSPGKEPS
jgi:hypothetical protein